MNSNTVNSLDAVFNVDATAVEDNTAALVVTGEVLPPAPTSTEREKTEAEKNAEEDMEFSRTQLKQLANAASNAVNRAVEVAQMTDSARSFEAVAAVIKAATDVHKTLQDAHKSAAERAAIVAPPAAKETPQVTVNNGIIFQGTADELLGLIKTDRK